GRKRPARVCQRRGGAGFGAALDPLVRQRDAGCRQAVLDDLYDGHHRIHVYGRCMSAYGDCLRSCAGAPCVEYERQWGTKRNRTLDLGKWADSSLDIGADDRGIGADARAADWRRLNDTKLSEPLSPERRLRDIAAVDNVHDFART